MRQKIVLCGALCSVLAMVSSAMASPTILLQGGSYQAGSGGEFTATVTSGGVSGHAVGSSFQTFCVETNEYISLGSTYYAVVNTAAVNGGVGGGNPDPLDPRTAWLYDQFCKGTLSGYDFANTGTGRSNSAAALQNAIWYIEQETTSLPSGLATTFYNLANNSGWTNIGSIRILNLYSDSCFNTPAQDVLVSTATVPVPGAVLLVGMGTAVVGALRRRFA